MRVAFAADHAGAAFKDELIRRLVVELGGNHELTDLGGDGSDPNDDYPDFAQAPRGGRAGRPRGPRHPDLRVRRGGVGRGQQDPAASGRRSATTRTRRTRAWSTTT